MSLTGCIIPTAPEIPIDEPVIVIPIDCLGHYFVSKCEWTYGDCEEASILPAGTYWFNETNNRAFLIGIASDNPYLDYGVCPETYLSEIYDLCVFGECCENDTAECVICE